LGRGDKHHVGLDSDHSGIGIGRGNYICGDPAGESARLRPPDLSYRVSTNPFSRSLYRYQPKSSNEHRACRLRVGIPPAMPKTTQEVTLVLEVELCLVAHSLD
jgi:hypothetical protein